MGCSSLEHDTPTERAAGWKLSGGGFGGFEVSKKVLKKSVTINGGSECNEGTRGGRGDEERRIPR